MTAAVPLIAEALSLAITEQFQEMLSLHCVHRSSLRASADPRGGGSRAADYQESYSAGVESLAVALHARLQEQGTLT